MSNNNNYGRNQNYANYGTGHQVPYSNAPAFNPYDYNDRPRPQYKKRSGAKSKRYTPTSGNNAGKGMIHTHGWRFTKRAGLITYSCNTTKKSVKKDTGWIGSIACEVMQVDSSQKAFYWGVMEAATGKVVIQDLGIVINPKANNGGYCGTFINKRR